MKCFLHVLSLLGKINLCFVVKNQIVFLPIKPVSHSMKAVLVNYNHDPQDWWLKYGFKPEDVTLYDRSDDKIERTFQARTYKTPNRGDVDADKLGYLIEHYHDLPEVFLWGKSNLFKYVDEEYFSKAVLNSEFTPLLKLDHRIYSDKWGEVNKYEGSAFGPIYAERNDGWIFHAGLDNNNQFSSWTDWARVFGLPSPAYIPFAPGGSYILTSERVHRYSRDFYQDMRDTLMYAAHPVEAHLAERSYYLLWR